MEDYDFSGWATRTNIKCSDGRTIRENAFADNDSQIVPLVWNHQHNESTNVLGHAMLQNVKGGVYTYGKFNNTEQGRNAKMLVENGDVTGLSIYANQLKQNGGDVLHGQIREVSLVLAGANPGAYIDNVIMHSDGSLESAIILSGDQDLTISHAENKENTEEVEESKEVVEEKGEQKEVAQNEKTIKEIFDTLSEEQKQAVYAIIGYAVEEAKGGDSEQGDEEMKQNVFDNDNEYNSLSHAEEEAIFADGKRYGSLKDAVLAHGIDNIEDVLFPDAQNVTDMPTFVQRDMDWVQGVMSGVHHTPFARIKSMSADITEDEARAKGYIKGKLKKEEVFSLLKRTTTPTTIYKKQKMDRDDLVDITDFDVVAWLKKEMRMMLDEEIARSILVGDGRLSSDDDKINETNIRPIAKDAELYVIQQEVAAGADDAATAKNMIKAAVKSKINYKGSGSPTLYTTEEVITECLLLEDGIGHPLYKDEAELARAMRVSKIVAVPVMAGATDRDGKAIKGIIVNLKDYTVGADKGGAVNMFDDFDIDYNAQKYLIETRCSGALTKPYSAICLVAAA